MSGQRRLAAEVHSWRLPVHLRCALASAGCAVLLYLDFPASPWPGETARALRRGAIAPTVPPARQAVRRDDTFEMVRIGPADDR